MLPARFIDGENFRNSIMATGGKKVLKQLARATRRDERDARRRQRELENQRKEMAKAEARQQAEYEVAVFENEVERLLSVHKDEPEIWLWQKIVEAQGLVEPINDGPLEKAARKELADYRPGFFEKLFGGSKKKILELAAKIEAGRKNDAINLVAAKRKQEEERAQHEAQRVFARRMLDGDVEAYRQALTEINPFEEISELGASISFPTVEARAISVRLRTVGESVVPADEKKLTATGKLSSKAMAKARFFEVYQNYICGCAMRMGRELFALLPVETALINIVIVGVDSRTGHDADETIISVVMSRETFGKLNFKRLNPADAMELFEHRMAFRKTAGFKSVKPLSLAGEAPTDSRPSKEPRKNSPAVAKPVEPISEAPEKSAVDSVLAEMFNALVESKRSVDGVSILGIRDLAPLLHLAEKGRLTIKESRALTEAVEQLGCAMEPDARMTGRAYAWEREVAVFRFQEGESRENSPAYAGMATLLSLCVAIAAADGSVDQNELDVFRKFLEGQLSLTAFDHRRLMALEKTLVNDPSAGARAIARVAASVSADKRPIVGRLVAQVAAANGRVTPAERKVVEKIYRAFELPLDSLDQMLSELLPEPADEGAAPASDRDAEAVNETGKPAAFSLDMSVIASISDETKEVVGILSVVLGERPAGGAEAETETTALTDEFVPPATDDWMEGLEEAVRPALKKLILQPEWGRDAFNALAHEFHQMPLNIFDTVNEWSDEALGDFLFEGENPIEVNRALIKG
jgi:tellurite resistance protein